MQWAIFPENGLANSVLPPVLAGLTFSTFFTETLGWNFSGLIVPGYLAPIFIVKPVSGLVILIEALATYIVLRFLSDAFSRMGIWTRFFGQDAFFALLCISILVKCLLEGPLQPFAGAFLQHFIPGSLDFRNEFHSMGLVVVPLLANVFWRHGIRRNLIPASLVIFLTYFFTSRVLIPYTNFSVSKFELMYSKMAVNFEESARYYFILLIGAFLASHTRYRYGWTYHGMLIPALLGVAWLTPLKIGTTFIEAGLILMIGVALTKTGATRNITLEGPRKLLLLFSIGFFLKWVIGFVLSDTIPGFQATDIYGFAYILPALIAMEMWPGRGFIHVTRITLQTSFLAAVIGLGSGIILQAIFPSEAQTSPDEPGSHRPAVARGTPVVIHRSGMFVPWLYEQVEERLGFGTDHISMSPTYLRRFDRRILGPLIRRINRNKPPAPIRKAFRILRESGYHWVTFDDTLEGTRYTILEEARSPFAYRGIFVFRNTRSQPIVIEVPCPLTEFNTLEVGMELFRDLNARALFIAGASRRKNTAEFSVTRLRYRKNLFQLAHQVIQRESIRTEPVSALQIRGSEIDFENGTDILMSCGLEIREETRIPPVLRAVMDFLDNAGLNVRVFKGDETDKQYSNRSNVQQAYSSSFNMGEFASLWCTPRRRNLFTSNDEKLTLIADKLGWEHVMKPVAALAAEAIPAEAACDKENLLDLVENTISNLSFYRQTGNILYLVRIHEQAHTGGFRCIDFMDPSRCLHLLVLTPAMEASLGTVAPIFFFHYRAGSRDTLRLIPGEEMNDRTIRRFFLGRYACLALWKGHEDR